MQANHDDGFMVYVRTDLAHDQRPDRAERLLTHCASYEEARRIQREWRRTSRECVIRFNGEVGGGD
jgi:hypothetical protein